MMFELAMSLMAKLTTGTQSNVVVSCLYKDALNKESQMMELVCTISSYFQ